MDIHIYRAPGSPSPRPDKTPAAIPARATDERCAHRQAAFTARSFGVTAVSSRLVPYARWSAIPHELCCVVGPWHSAVCMGTVRTRSGPTDRPRLPRVFPDTESRGLLRTSKSARISISPGFVRYGRTSLRLWQVTPGAYIMPWRRGSRWWRALSVQLRLHDLASTPSTDRSRRVHDAYPGKSLAGFQWPLVSGVLASPLVAPVHLCDPVLRQGPGIAQAQYGKWTDLQSRW